MLLDLCLLLASVLVVDRFTSSRSSAAWLEAYVESVSLRALLAAEAAQRGVIATARVLFDNTKSLQ